jgi:hypothetical protein
MCMFCKGSNTFWSLLLIIRFQNVFEPVHVLEKSIVLRYNRENKIKKNIMSGHSK